MSCHGHRNDVDQGFIYPQLDVDLLGFVDVAHHRDDDFTRAQAIELPDRYPGEADVRAGLADTNVTEGTLQLGQVDAYAIGDQNDASGVMSGHRVGDSKRVARWIFGVRGGLFGEAS